VEECEGGWLVVCFGFDTTGIEFVSGDVRGGGGVGGARLGEEGSGDGEFKLPSALALVPGLGLVVRELGNDGRVQFFATPDAIAMASMSATRVGWMVAVSRGALHRRGVTSNPTRVGSKGKQRRRVQEATK
jgi:hypothetical protein